MLVVIMGTAGSGKDSIKRLLCEEYGYISLVTATTRAPRAGEENGINYNFMSENEFMNRIESGEIFEYTSFETTKGKTYYGSLYKELDPAKNYCIVLDPQGAEKYVEAYGKENVFVCQSVIDEQTRCERAFVRAFGNVPVVSEESKKEFYEKWNKRAEQDNIKFSCASKFVNFYADNSGSLDAVVSKIDKAVNEYVSSEKSTYEIDEALPDYF